jgi:transcriptional regulator with XRE-family HTH domain
MVKRSCPHGGSSGGEPPCGQPLRELRAARSLSIRELAQAASVSTRTITETERGRTIPSPSVIRRLTAALGVGPGAVREFQHVVDRSEDPPPMPEPWESLRSRRRR